MPDAMTENPLHQRNRLAWQCRRGMRELDVLLNEYLARRYARLDAKERDCFARLLEYPDAVLLEWLLGRMIPTDREVARIVQDIRHTASP